MAQHTDVHVVDMEYTPREPIEEFEGYNEAVTSDSEITNVTNDDVEIEYQLPLALCLAEKICEERDTENIDEARRSKMFDVEVYNLADRILDRFGLHAEDVSLPKLRALLLKETRSLSFVGLHRHLSQYKKEERAKLGIAKVYGEKTYRDAFHALEESRNLEQLEKAADYTLMTLLRDCFPFPSEVKNSLSYRMTPSKDASDYSNDVRHAALYALLEDILDIVTENFTVEGTNIKPEKVRSIIGAFAFSAYGDNSFERYSADASHIFDLTSNVKGPTIRQTIQDIRLGEVEKIFENIHTQLLKYILDSGVVSRPAILSYDLTKVQSIDRSDDYPRFLTEDGKWRFGALAFTDPQLDYAIGLHLLKSEAHRAQILSKFIRRLNHAVDEVDILLADRGFDGREVIEICQSHVNGYWAIRAQDDRNTTSQSDFERLQDQLRGEQMAVVPNAGYKDLHPKVNLVGTSGFENLDSDEIKRAFLTNIDQPDMVHLHNLLKNDNSTYMKRHKIEAIFRMAKNKFDIATDSDHPSKKSFYFHMSVLFYNIYQIVNTVPSPTNGLEIDATQSEVLIALTNIAFRGARTSDGLQQHLG